MPVLSVYVTVLSVYVSVLSVHVSVLSAHVSVLSVFISYIKYLHPTTIPALKFKKRDVPYYIVYSYICVASYLLLLFMFYVYI